RTQMSAHRSVRWGRWESRARVRGSSGADPSAGVADGEVASGHAGGGSGVQKAVERSDGKVSLGALGLHGVAVGLNLLTGLLLAESQNGSDEVGDVVGSGR